MHPIIAAVNWTAVSIVGTLFVSIAGSLFGLYQARKADRSATFTKTIEVGVTSLVDQLQEEVATAKHEALECKGECEALRVEVRDLRRKVETLKTDIDNKDAEIIRLKVKAGEL